MHVAIAIVGFRNLADIQRCLGALKDSTHADFEVVICENGGAQAFEALSVLPKTLKGGQPVRAVLAPSNLGYAGGVNACMRETPDADAWWVLNPDTLPAADCLALQVARLGRGDCQAVGCTIELPDRVQSHGGEWKSWVARAISIGHSTPLGSRPEPEDIERRQSYLNGASMLVSRRFLEVTGMMREEYFLYCEEVEWCLRGISKGMKLGYAPGALVLHYQGTTTGSAEAISTRPRLPVYLNERNKMLTTWDCFPLRMPVAALGGLAQIFARYGRRGAWRQVGYGIAGWAAGVCNRRGVPRWFSA